TIAKPYENFVEVSGAVEYPGRFQLTSSMRISDALNKGVLAKEARFDVAYVYRVNPDETVRLIRVDLKSIIDDVNSGANFVLEPKDKIQILSTINFIEKSTVSAVGALREPTTIDFDPSKGIRVADLILLSNGLLPNAAEFAYLKRTDITNKDRVDFVRVNLFEVLKDTTSVDNRVLEPLDQLIVYTNEAFTDEADVVVTGAVRTPGEFNFGEGLKVVDLVYFADGLQTEAAEFAYINRLNLETKVIEYIRVNLKEAMADPLSPENIELKPFDKLDVMSKTTFIDETLVKVDGAVRVPGEYPYDKTLQLQDVLTMAGGLKFGAASNRVEVSRLIIQNNQPTRTTVALLEVDQNLQPSTGNSFQLEPYDHVIVRNVPDFKLQRNIT
ncbi:MAG: SLBB domain-containing protein, partial [Bacteroidota bacterium]